LTSPNLNISTINLNRVALSSEEILGLYGE